MTWECLPRRVLWFWEVMVAVLALLLLGLTGMIFVRAAVVRLVLLGIFGFAWLFVALVYLPLWQRSYRYGLTEHQLMLAHGVFFWRKSQMARDKIVFVSRIDTPMTTLFSLSTLLVTASGGYLLLLCLDGQQAKKIQQALLLEEP